MPLAGRARSRPWPQPQWPLKQFASDVTQAALGFICPSPGGRVRALGRSLPAGYTPPGPMGNGRECGFRQMKHKPL